MKSTILALPLLLLSTTLANPILRERGNLPQALNERDAAPVPLSNLLAGRAPAPEPKKHKSKKPHKSSAGDAGSSEHSIPTASESGEVSIAPSAVADSVTGSATIPKATGSLQARAPEPKKTKKKTSAHHSSTKKGKKASKTPGLVPSATAKLNGPSVSGSEATTLPPSNGGGEPTATKSASAAQVSARAAEPEPEPAKSKKATAVASAKKSAASGGAGDPAPSKAASKVPKITARDALPEPEPAKSKNPSAVAQPKKTSAIAVASAKKSAPAPSKAVAPLPKVTARNALPDPEAKAEADPIVIPPEPIQTHHAAVPAGAVLDTPTVVISSIVPSRSAVAKREAEANPIVIPPEPIQTHHRAVTVSPQLHTPTVVMSSIVPSTTGFAKRDAKAEPIVIPPEPIQTHHPAVKATTVYADLPSGNGVAASAEPTASGV